MERLFNHQTIDEFLLDITETAEYKRIEYLKSRNKRKLLWKKILRRVVYSKM